MLRTIRRSTARSVLIARKVQAKLFAPAVRVTDRVPVLPEAEGLAGKVVLITGSSRGIGLVLARAFMQAGAQVIITARSEARLSAARNSLGADSDRVVAIAADLAAPEGPERLVAQAVEQCSHVDILINNAGTSGPAQCAVWDATANAWDDVWRTNVLAPAACAAALVRRARETRRPVRILNVSSGIVGHGAANLGPYAMSKDALEGLTRALAADDTEGLVTAASIQPRSVRTDMTRRYYDGVTFAMLDDPDVVTPVFLWAAQAPSTLVNGRTFSEPAFSASAVAATAICGSMAASAPIQVLPETFRPGARHFELPGAYMHLLENAQGYSPAAADSLATATPPRAVWAYPDPSYRDLRERIGTEAGVPATQVAVCPGSSEMIDRILRLFCSPGDPIVMTKPTWSFFHAFVRRWQLVPTEVTLQGSMREHSMRHDLDGLLRAITPATRLVYLINPCNPTGTMVAREDLERFVRALPMHVVCVLDEAYIQYADPAQRPDVQAMIATAAARVIVLRTFSKFFGLSGLRIGYACASEETIGLLARGEIPFGVSAPAVAAVPAVLGDHAFRARVFEANQMGREQLYRGLAALDIAYQPSQTNFILFECPTDPARLRADLQAKGLVLPNVDQFLRNYSVLTIGQRQHNDMVLEALRRY